jgi:hypothetical protein
LGVVMLDYLSGVAAGGAVVGVRRLLFEGPAGTDSILAGSASLGRSCGAIGREDGLPKVTTWRGLHSTPDRLPADFAANGVVLQLKWEELYRPSAAFPGEPCCRLL